MKKKSCILTALVFTLASSFIVLRSNKETLLRKQEASPGLHHTNSFDAEIFRWSQTLGKAFALVQERYFQPFDISKAMVRALNAFVCNDPHSTCLDATLYDNLLNNTQGEFCGIGIVIDAKKELNDEVVVIQEVLQDHPASKAGIMPGDKILACNNQTLKGRSIEETLNLLKGKRKSNLELTILRDGHIHTYNLVRDAVKQTSCTTFKLENHNILYMALHLFTPDSVNTLKILLSDSNNTHAKGLILDLRNNAGGRLDTALDIAGLFLEKNSLVVSTKNSAGKLLQEYRTTQEPLPTLPKTIFILVNHYTASAAEILAQVLRFLSIDSQSSCTSENNTQKPPTVYIIGTSTFGKGSVQELIPITPECALKITIGLYYFADGSCLHGKGIIPDFEIKPKVNLSKETEWINNNLCKERDQSHNAHNNSQSAQAPYKTNQEQCKETLSTDYTLLSTVRLMELYTLANLCYPEKMSTRQEALALLKELYVPDDKITLKELNI